MDKKSWVKPVLFALLSSGLAMSACQPTLTPSLTLRSQNIQYGIIIVPRAIIDKPGWLVLHPAAANGELDTASVLAHTYLPARGEYSEVELTVGTSLTGEQFIFAMLHYDDPNDGRFTFSLGNSDDPPVRVGGREVVKPFRVVGETPLIRLFPGTTATLGD